MDNKYQITQIESWRIPTPAPDDLQGMFDALGLEWIQDIVYKRIGDRELTLDVLRPRNLTVEGDSCQKDLLPSVFCIHGGAWRHGTNKNYNAATFAANGYVTFNLRYRFTGEAPYPADLEDCRDALAWIAQNGPAYGADPMRLGIRGGSSGAHLALMLSLENARSAETDPGYRIKAVTAACAPSHLPACYQDARDAGLDFSTAFDMLLGETIGDQAQKLEPLSPWHVLDRMSADQIAKLPPFLLMHGLADPLVSCRQSMMLYDLMRQKGVNARLELFEGAKHNYMFDGERFCPERMAIIMRFMDQYLK